MRQAGTKWRTLCEPTRGGLGDLGGGNHFLDAIVPYDDGPLHFLIHWRSDGGANVHCHGAITHSCTVRAQSVKTMVRIRSKVGKCFRMNEAIHVGA